MITIDGRAVRCFTKTEILWELPWEGIAEVRRTSHLSSAAIQLVPVNEPKQDLHTPQAYPFLGFQRSSKVNQALQTYCHRFRG